MNASVIGAAITLTVMALSGCAADVPGRAEEPVPTVTQSASGIVTGELGCSNDWKCLQEVARTIHEDVLAPPAKRQPPAGGTVLYFTDGKGNSYVTFRYVLTGKDFQYLVTVSQMAGRGSYAPGTAANPKPTAREGFVNAPELSSVMLLWTSQGRQMGLQAENLKDQSTILLTAEAQQTLLRERSQLTMRRR